MQQFKMLSFTKVAQEYPSKKEVEQRIQEFKEIYKDRNREDFHKQASRCSQCGIPFCQIGCPLNNNIPDWLYLTAKGRVSEAYSVAAKTNTFPEICGRICPQEKLCEGACVIERSGHKAVTIGSIESYITEEAFRNNEVEEIPRNKNNGKKIAIVGSGPCGLATAVDLRGYGFSVDIYERNVIPGGLMSYGIPSFKLEKDVVLRRLNWLKRSGIKFITNCNVGIDISYEKLSLEYYAVVLANGVYSPRKLDLQNPDIGIINSLDFLVAQNSKEYSSFINYSNINKTFNKVSNKIKKTINGTRLSPSSHSLLGLDVVVIGAGDTAMDCIRTAIRKKAKSVTCVYRKDFDNMPCSRQEYRNALEEGCKFIFLASPKEYVITSREEGKGCATKLSAVRFEKMRLSRIEREGIRELRSLDDFFEIKCDLAIEALGFSAESIEIEKSKSKKHQRLVSNKLSGIINCKQETAKLDYQLAGTNFYIGGDLARGGSLVVYAIKDGKSIAKKINAQLRKNER